MEGSQLDSTESTNKHRAKTEYLADRRYRIFDRSRGRPREVTQNLVLPGATPGSGPIQSRTSPADTLFVSTGRKLYVVGDIDGGFRPRSNPYDSYNFGKPLRDDPLANKLQGVWAQPVKALNGYTFEVGLSGCSRWTWLAPGRKSGPAVDGAHSARTLSRASRSCLSPAEL